MIYHTRTLNNIAQDMLAGFGAALPQSVINRVVDQALRRLYREGFDSWWQVTEQYKINAPVEVADASYTASTRTLASPSGAIPAWGAGQIVLFGGEHGRIDIVAPDQQSAILRQEWAPTEDSADTATVCHDAFQLGWTPGRLGRLTGWGRELAGVSREAYWAAVNTSAQPGTPKYYAVLPWARGLTDEGVFMWPPPTTGENVWIVGTREPHISKVLGTDKGAGTVTLTAGSAVVAGSATAFSADLHTGEVLTVPLTGRVDLYGRDPYGDAFRIKSVDSPTQLTLYTPAPKDGTGLPYRICGYVDVDDSLWGLLLAYMRLMLALEVGKAKDYMQAEVREARRDSRSAYNKGRTRFVVGYSGGRTQRLADMPLGPTVEF